MAWLLFAGLCFGISYPGGKWITQTGLELLPFCILFTFSRIAFQLPVVWKNGGAKVQGWKQWRLLLALGLVGATLRFSEFFGIVEGLPVSLVSFLVYLHPVWTIVFSRWLNGENISRVKLTKIFFALIGTALVVDLSSVSNLGSMLGHLWSPIAAGMLISLWICLSTRSQQEGASVVSVSFYYDLFTLVPLVLVAVTSLSFAQWHQTLVWLFNPTHLGMLLGYTLLTGVLPNYSFYFGLRKATALAAALCMLFEPIAATLISVYAWDEPLSPNFYWGAILILMLNLPDYFWNLLVPSRRARPSIGDPLIKPSGSGKLKTVTNFK